MRQYPFKTGAVGLELLRRLITVNRRVFALAKERVEATEDPRETARHIARHLLARFVASLLRCSLRYSLLTTYYLLQARHGEHLYVMKPTMKSSKKSEGKGTWSDDEYAHPGLQVTY